MIICHCRRVTDRAIAGAIREGASTVEAISEMCGAGTRCGGCLPAVCELLEREGCDSHRHLPVMTSAA